MKDHLAGIPVIVTESLADTEWNEWQGGLRSDEREIPMYSPSLEIHD